MKTRFNKLTAWLLTLAMLMTLVPSFTFTAFAADSDITYWYCDEKGANWQTGTKEAGEYESVTSSDTAWGTSGSATWYVASDEITISSRITVKGNVHLILADGATLTAESGIGVNEGNSLTIYGQEAGTGTLVAKTTTNFDAGIGGTGGASGQITINGGNVKATGGAGGAGIGGGTTDNFDSYVNGNVTVNGGSVVAQGGRSAAGIGGGNGGNGTVIINGGSVEAQGEDMGAGIGGGFNIFDDGNGNGTVTINGGTVQATGGLAGAGIGGGESGSGNVTISGGTTIAQGKIKAFDAKPTIDSKFDLAVWYGDSEAAANAAGAQNISDLAANYNKNYVKIACDHSGSTHETPTPDEDGNTHSFTCTVCGTAVSEACSGGTATCTEKAVCTVCGESYGEEPTGHSTAAEGDKAATCTAKAYCSVCDSEYGEFDKTNHDETVKFDINGFCPSNCDTYESATGSGTEDAPYQISNAGQLFWFAQQVNSGNGSINGSINGKLTTDINLESRAWTPITNFSGTFDGAGYEIKNFAMDIGTAGYHGLFGSVNDATIKDFTIYGEVTSELTAEPNEFNYGVIGEATGNTIITDIHSYVNLTIKDSYFRNFIGGILGRRNDGAGELVIERCSFSGTLNLGAAQVDCTGGIVAYVFAGCTAKLNNCLFDGKIISEYNSDMQVGGLMGYYRGENLTITNSLSIGDFTISKKNKMGSLVGILREHKRANQMVTNNYYRDENQPFGNSGNTTNSDDITDSNSSQKVELSATAVTQAKLESGEVAYLLGEAWGQLIGIDVYPVLGGDKVLFADDGYYNIVEFAIKSNGTDGAKATATVAIPTVGTYTLIFADYEETRLNKVDTVTFTVDEVGTMTVPSEIDITLGIGDKIMLWKDMTTLVPLCEAYIVE